MNKIEKKKKVLLVGAKSYIGEKLIDSFKINKIPFVASHHTIFHDYKIIDLLNLDLSSLEWIDNTFTDAIITAGITKIEKCEKEKQSTYLCNVENSLKLIEFLHLKNIKPIIFSTDYVYDGKFGDYSENSSYNPLNQYGYQKLILEECLKKICKNNYLIIRLGKVIGNDPFDNTLINEMIFKLLSNEKIKAAYDQILTPIFIDNVIENTLILLNNNASGYFILCGNEKISRFDLAKQIAEKLNLDKKLIQSISLSDLNESFKRPKNTSMLNDKIKKTNKIDFTSIDSIIQNLIKKFKNTTLWKKKFGKI